MSICRLFHDALLQREGERDTERERQFYDYQINPDQIPTQKTNAPAYFSVDEPFSISISMLDRKKPFKRSFTLHIESETGKQKAFYVNLVHSLLVVMNPLVKNSSNINTTMQFFIYTTVFGSDSCKVGTAEDRFHGSPSYRAVSAVSLQSVALLLSCEHVRSRSKSFVNVSQ